ncbi:envelope glycoprotein B [Saimiriine betaherpesvirus 4]|uniref:Envelope glycoprotein B n=1 Tax=Saimiriine betaherpesvirus 4 TaxID=1535247 RepID=G8XSX0_9BETA|nr:envelope glycoprotein B [Saimiriine betaherpesvirus 4]AEV80916.1 envelope glycoprotein B [Saimiriine betaherpesvirus 4]
MWKVFLYLSVFINFRYGVSSNTTSAPVSESSNRSTSSVMTSGTSRVSRSSGSVSASSSSVAANVTSTPIPKTIFNTTLRENEVLSVNTSKYPYRICSMAQGTDIVRFAKNIKCTPFNPNTDFEEGIMVVYKRNIVTHTFKVILYQKVMTFQRSYRYVYSTYLLGNTVERVAVPMWEVHYVDRASRCYTSYTRVMNGNTYVLYHQDNHQNDTMWLVEDDYSNSHNRRYVTVKEVWTTYGSAWMYKETCSLNCVVTITMARSRYPYDFFVLTSGDIVDISPFYDGTNGKSFKENADKFYIRRNYTKLTYYGDSNAPWETYDKVAFFQRSDVSMSWVITDENKTVCQYKFWDSSDRTIRTEGSDTYHFSSQELTATFVASKNDVSENGQKSEYQCIQDEARQKLERIYNQTYNSTYEKKGNVTMHITTGGLIVFWQGVTQKSIASLERLINNASEANSSTTSRRKRSADSSNSSSSDSERSLLYSQVQFTYDTLKNYINNALGHLVEAWCIDQRRTLEVFAELSKVNPTRIMSAIYDKPVAAKFMGDVIGIAKCVLINQTSVKVLRDMHVLDGPMKGQCYARPVLLYTFVNSSHVQYGQLGEDNEVLVGRHRTELCEYPSVKVFIVGDVGYKYVDYYFKGLINLDSIEIVDTMIRLNIEPLENTDFRMLELYSKDELRSANVFDLEEIMREFNSYKQRMRFVEDKVADNIPPYLRGLDDFMSGLGEAGKHLGVAIGAVGGAVASVMEGIGSFLKNPFGSFTVLLFLLAVLGVIFLIYQRQKRTYEKPLEVLFPYTSQMIKEAPPPYSPPPYTDVSKPSSKNQLSSEEDDKYSPEDAKAILKALMKYDEQERRNLKRVSEEGSEGGTGILDALRYRSRGYNRLVSED